MTTKEVSEFIKSGEIQKLIKENLSTISAFSVNGNHVDTVEEATSFKKMLYKILLPVFLGIGILLIAGYVLFFRHLFQSNYSY